MPMRAMKDVVVSDHSEARSHSQPAAVNLARATLDSPQAGTVTIKSLDSDPMKG